MITLNKVLISLVHLKTNMTGLDLHIYLSRKKFKIA